MGVIEAPIHKMLKAFPDEFKFMKHETRRSLDGKRSSDPRLHGNIAKLQSYKKICIKTAVVEVLNRD